MSIVDRKRRKSEYKRAGAITYRKVVEKKQTMLSRIVLRYVDNIYLFLADMQVTLTWQQKELVDAYDRGDLNITIKAGKGPGKTFITTLIALHWLLTHPFGVGIVTAPTFRQCKSVWQSQMEKLVIKPNTPSCFKRLFKFYGKGMAILNYRPDIWGFQLITARDGKSIQGIHNKYLFMLEEEASGVPGDISQAIVDTLVNPKGAYRHIRIGNPNSREGAFYDGFYRDLANKWTKLTWNAEETPESDFFSSRRNEELAEEFGKDSDVYRVAVLGEFPQKDASCLIDEAMLRLCTTDDAYENAYEWAVKHNDFTKQIGIDLARSGDRNAIVVRQGNIILRKWSATCSPLVALDKACMFQEELGWDNDEVTYVIDTAGMGEGLVELMGDIRQRGKKVHEFYTQNTAHESAKYDDKATEAWCHLNKLIRETRVYMGEKLDSRTLLQAISRLFKVTPKGKIKIESKQDYKDRMKKQMKGTENGAMGKSPDEMDALVMCFYPYATQSTRITSK